MLTKMEAVVKFDQARREARIWFWRPQWHWFGWKTLIPFMYGHDEYARRTLLLGWTVTGRVIIPLWFCGDEKCLTEGIEAMRVEEGDLW